MSFSCPVCASWDLSVGALTHTYWTSSAPPAPDTFVFSFEMFVPMRWTGVHLGLGSMSRSVVVSPESEWVVLEDHDVGPMILDVTYPPNNVWLPITWLLSGRVVMFSSSSVEFEGTAVGTPYFFMPMITCADPVPLPTAIPIGMQYRHQTYVGVTGMDALLGLIKTAASIAIEAAFAKGDIKAIKKGGKFGKKSGSGVAKSELDRVGKKAADALGDQASDKARKKAARKAKREARNTAKREAREDAAAEAARKNVKKDADKAAEEARAKAEKESRDATDAAYKKRLDDWDGKTGRKPQPKATRETDAKAAGDGAADAKRDEIMDKAEREARAEFAHKLRSKKFANKAFKSYKSEFKTNIAANFAHNFSNFVFEAPFEGSDWKDEDIFATVDLGPLGHYGVIVTPNGDVTPVAGLGTEGLVKADENSDE